MTIETEESKKISNEQLVTDSENTEKEASRDPR